MTQEEIQLLEYMEENNREEITGEKVYKVKLGMKKEYDGNVPTLKMLQKQWDRQKRKFKYIISRVLKPFLKSSTKKGLDDLINLAEEKKWTPVLEKDPDELLKLKELKLSNLGKN